MTEKKVFHSISAKQTQRVGFLLAREVVKRKQGKQAIVFALQGNLGSGKTTFIQGFGRGLGVEEKILSPTFVILKKYRVSKEKPGIRNFYHVDCYRIKGEKDIRALGWEDILGDPQSIVLVEWAERIQEALPKDTMWITFESQGEEKRTITIHDGKA